MVRTGGEHPLATNAGHPRTGEADTRPNDEGGRARRRAVAKENAVGNNTGANSWRGVCVSTWSDTYVNRSCDGRNSVCKQVYCGV